MFRLRVQLLIEFSLRRPRCNARSCDALDLQCCVCGSGHSTAGPGWRCRPRGRARSLLFVYRRLDCVDNAFCDLILQVEYAG